MKLTGLHLLLTYRCTFACDHCFVWGSPDQVGVMSPLEIGGYLEQARAAGSIRTIFFEGGEPFLYPETLAGGIRQAAELGFQTGIVTNAFWAASPAAALAALTPLAGSLHALTLSSDLFHYAEQASPQLRHAQAAAAQLGISTSVISVPRPEDGPGVMYRGRAAVRLAPRAARLPGSLRPWDSFTACPHENLANPGRVHLDPFGNVHVCHGIVPGNLGQTALADLCANYDPDNHPILGPLIQGGPSGLAREYHLPHAETYVDACQLCYAARLALRPRFAETLTPDAMYGIFERRPQAAGTGSTTTAVP
jgi:hypothetical protein